MEIQIASHFHKRKVVSTICCNYDKSPQPKPNLTLDEPHIQDISTHKYDFIKAYINRHRKKLLK